MITPSNRFFPKCQINLPITNQEYLIGTSRPTSTMNLTFSGKCKFNLPFTGKDHKTTSRKKLPPSKTRRARKT